MNVIYDIMLSTMDAKTYKTTIDEIELAKKRDAFWETNDEELPF